MTVMMDILGSTIVVGMLMLTIMNVNIKLTDENYKAICEFRTQTELIQLGRIIEFDLYKIGYSVPKVASQIGEQIQIADTGSLKFYTNLFNVNGAKDSVQYDLGGNVAASSNPRDRMLVRYENTTKVYIDYSVVKFKLTYYDASMNKLSTPVTGASRDSIKAIGILLKLESPEPFDTTRSGGYSYVSATYQKLIYPRNL